MLIMSLIIAAVALSTALQGSSASDAPAPEPRAAAAPSAAASAGEGAAREWVALLDDQRWEESWRTAAALFQSPQTPEQWAAMVRPVRQPLGAVSSRVLQSATKANSLPGAPAGEYEILQFRTSFEKK